MVASCWRHARMLADLVALSEKGHGRSVLARSAPARIATEIRAQSLPARRYDHLVSVDPPVTPPADQSSVGGIGDQNHRLATQPTKGRVASRTNWRHPAAQQRTGHRPVVTQNQVKRGKNS
jgi:hypothetical protein